MILKVVLLFCVGYEANGKHVKTVDPPESGPTLQWPSNYSVEARKYYMSSSLIENFKYWRTNLGSKVEVNDGAVIQMIIANIAVRGKYEIHPETTEEETNKMVCTKETAAYVSPENFLPSVRFLSAQGYERVRGINCMKFTNANQSVKMYEKTLWAYYQNASDTWIPIRYKIKEIDEWHGYLLNYEILDYFNFKTDVNPDVFNITYECKNKEIDGSGAKRKTATDFFSLYLEEKKNLGDGYTYKSLKNKESHKEEKKVGLLPFPYTEAEVKNSAANLPKEYDLRLEGLVGPVLNTQQCVSDWAFAVTAAVEGAVARSNGGTWIKLSEQALIDCTWGYGNKGCTTGKPTQTYPWIIEHGLPTEQKYGTYTNRNGFCKIQNMTKTYKIKGYVNVPPLSVEHLKLALINHGPVVVHVDPILSLVYEEGILYIESCRSSPDDLTDYMTVVGYGEKDGDTFWILKNSKGPYTGLDGYIHISARDNNCGVMTEPTYVVANLKEN